MNIYQTRQGFTLMEVLIVVLIVAILSAVAVPQYQKAVMKSRYSALMPIAKSLANGNEAYYMDKGQYATSPTELDVAGQDEKYPDGTKVDMSAGEYSYVLAKRDNLPLNYLVYQKHSEKFADNIHCEADENNTMAKEVCQGLGGELINGSQTEGYLTYVLSGMVGANDKLPSSLTKLAANLCAGKPNCTATISGNQVTTQECSGDANTAAGQTCINTAYNDTGTQVDYEKTQTKCEYKSGRGYPNPFHKCTTQSFDDQNKKIGGKEEACYTKYATWEDGVCTPTGSSQYYSQIITEGNKKVSTDYWCYSSNNDFCGTNVKSVTEYLDNIPLYDRTVYCNGIVNADNTCNDGEWQRSRITDYNSQGNSTRVYECLTYSAENVCIDVATDSTRWRNYAEDGITLISETKITPNITAERITFETTDEQTNQVTNTVTCARADADWKTGTCKPGTAI